MKNLETPIQKKEVKKTKKSNTGLKVAAGALAGAAAGALAGVLLAPDSGKATRKKIADQSKKVVADTKKKVTDKVKSLTKKGDKKTAKLGFK